MLRSKTVKKPLTEVNEAFDFALNKLSYRDYSEKELEGKLLERSCPLFVLQEVMAKLKDYRFIDDLHFARNLYQAWLYKKYYGKEHLKAYLYKKQLPKEIQSLILAQLTYEIEYERAAAFAAVQWPKSLKKYSEEPYKAKQHLGMRLMAKGFMGDIVHDVISNLANYDG